MKKAKTESGQESRELSTMTNNKTCFVIAPIGAEDSDIRKYSDKVLRFIIKHSIEPMGYTVLRADEISEPGTINLQVIGQILQSDLVITDLTTTNPNVMYELAIRHAINKPSILIARIGEKLPFDIAHERIILFNINDIESVEATRKAISEQIRFIESQDFQSESPFSIATGIVTNSSTINPLSETIFKIAEDLAYLKNEFNTLVAGIRQFPSEPVNESSNADLVESSRRYTEVSDTYITYLKLLSELDTLKHKKYQFVTKTENWIKINLEYPAAQNTKVVDLELSSKQSLSDTLNEIWFMLRDDIQSKFLPDANTYLWDWILIRKEDGLPLVVKSVMHKINAFTIFSDNESWQVIKLDEPLLNNSERFGIYKGKSDNKTEIITEPIE